MILYLMRHGETDYNKARCFYGSSDVSINATGQEQAQSLGRLMESFSVGEIYTSGLVRSQETASLIFPDRSEEFIVLSGLDEKGFGAWEGLTADEIEAGFPSEWSAWLNDPFGVTPPEAESFAAFRVRVGEALTQILAENQSKDALAIVAHLGVLRLIYQILVDREAVFWDIDFPQGTVTRVKQSDRNTWSANLLTNKGGTDESIYDG